MNEKDCTMVEKRLASQHSQACRKGIKCGCLHVFSWARAGNGLQAQFLIGPPLLFTFLQACECWEPGICGPCSLAGCAGSLVCWESIFASPYNQLTVVGTTYVVLRKRHGARWVYIKRCWTPVFLVVVVGMSENRVMTDKEDHSFVGKQDTISNSHSSWGYSFVRDGLMVLVCGLKFLSPRAVYYYSIMIIVRQINDISC